MTEAEAYTAKENAKAALLTALQDYLTAAKAMGLEDDEQRAELDDVFTDAGKSWELRPG